MLFSSGFCLGDVVHSVFKFGSWTLTYVSKTFSRQADLVRPWISIAMIKLLLGAEARLVSTWVGVLRPSVIEGFPDIHSPEVMQVH